MSDFRDGGLLMRSPGIRIASRLGPSVQSTSRGGVARADLSLREADVEITVEVAAERGDPLEAPPHAPFVGLDVRARRIGGHDEGSVAVREMHVDAVEAVGPERTAVTPFLPVGPEHEVVDRELTAPGKH